MLKEQGKTEDAEGLFNKASELAPANFKDQIKQLAAGTPSPAPSPTSSPTSAPETSSPTPQASPAEKN